jgi:tRNA threonylcarbamoyladenosine biosynthesis protein TsaB
VELFAAATGPGSFTGIRVGLAATQGWAKAFGRPVCGVSVLESMVEAAEPKGRVAVPLLDARRGELYLGVFRREASDEASPHDDTPFRLSGEGRVLDSAHVSALLRGAGGSEAAIDIELIVKEQDESALIAARQLAGVLDNVRWTTVPSLHAPAVARLALRAAREGRLQQPEQLDALYIRRSDAEINWRE